MASSCNHGGNWLLEAVCCNCLTAKTSEQKEQIAALTKEREHWIATAHTFQDERDELRTINAALGAGRDELKAQVAVLVQMLRGSLCADCGRATNTGAAPCGSAWHDGIAARAHLEHVAKLERVRNAAEHYVMTDDSAASMSELQIALAAIKTEKNF